MATFISIRTFVSPQITVTHLSFKNDTWNFCSNNLEKFIEERCIYIYGDIFVTYFPLLITKL